MTLSGACIKELDRLDCTTFMRYAKHIDLPERCYLIELYEKRWEVLKD